MLTFAERLPFERRAIFFYFNPSQPLWVISKCRSVEDYLSVFFKIKKCYFYTYYKYSLIRLIYVHKRTVWLRG